MKIYKEKDNKKNVQIEISEIIKKYKYKGN